MALGWGNYYYRNDSAISDNGYVKPSTVSLLDAFEPLSATVGSVLIFGLVMSGMDWLGTALVITAVLALNFTPKRKIKKTENK